MAPKIIIAGAPASGKGTQCELIRDKYGVVHLSTRDMLREAVAQGTEVGLEAKQYMEAGNLVPDEVIIGAVKERLAQSDVQEKGWLLDGFPRTGAQAEALKEAGIEADIFIVLNVPDEDLIERVVGRRLDPVSGKIYHMTLSPPEDIEIKARLTQRSDDTEEKARVRLETFHQNMGSIMAHYESIKVELDGTKDKHSIFQQIVKGIDSQPPPAPPASAEEATPTPPPPAVPTTASTTSTTTTTTAASSEGGKPLRVIIAGAPASGKGTQCELIREKFGLVHLSTGDMLREAAAQGTGVGQLAKQYMEAGKLVPDDVIIGAVKERLAQPDAQEKGWLLDGFPRTKEQAEALKEAGIEVDVFIFLNVPDEDLIERVVGRRLDPVTGKIYHMTFSPPENDEIKNRLTQRADDTEEKVRVRLEAFHQHMGSIKHHYADIQIEVDGTQKKMQIFETIERKLEASRKWQVVFVLGGPGAGKGTQCKHIVDTFGYTHLSAGELLREERSSGSDLSEIINKYIKEDRIVPAEVTVNLLLKAMDNSKSRKFLVEGFPRSLDNFQAWHDIMGPLTILNFALFFDCPKAVMEERLMERGKISGRVDDNLESIKKRFRTFREESMPVVEYLRRLGKIRTILAIPPPSVVFAQVRRIFEGTAKIPLRDRTFAMIKPDAVSKGHSNAIIQAIEEAGFVIVGQLKRTLTKEEAETFYGEHKGKGFFDRLIAFMTAGPVMALALERENAVKTWRQLMGPTNTIKALEEAPESLRARYGTDGTQNATHGSDSDFSAARELQFWFPDGYGKYKTFAMIKPFTADLHYEDIKSIIVAHGFEIVVETHTQLTKEKAGEFYAEHEGKGFYDELVKYMSSNKVVALTLERAGAIRGWRELAGPTNTFKARKEKPQSIRALYGIDGTMNAVHGSDSIEAAQRELYFWFPKPPMKAGKGLLAPASISTESWPEMQAYMNTSVDPVLAPIILRALVQRPPNFISFCIEELREVQRLAGPTGAGLRGELPPVRPPSSPRPSASPL